MMLFFTFIEVLSISMITKDFKVSNHICCVSRPFIVKAIHFIPYVTCYSLLGVWLIICINIFHCYCPIAVSTLIVSTYQLVIVSLANVVPICYSTNTSE